MVAGSRRGCPQSQKGRTEAAASTRPIGLTGSSLYENMGRTLVELNAPFERGDLCAPAG